MALTSRLARITTAAVVSLGVLLGAGSAPLRATDPSPDPLPPARTPSIHADMLAEHAADDHDFTPGGRPQAFRADAAIGPGVQSATGATGLPNGLQREVFGYLPSWSLTPSALASMSYDLVTTIAYFGVAARADGTLATSGDGWDGWNSSLMTDVINAAHAEGVKVVLTVTMMAWDGNYTNMAALLNTPANRNALASRIATALTDRNADGVNLDFEPVPNHLESAYTTFVHAVKSAIGSRYLTVATTGGAASWDEGYELVDNTDADSHSLISTGGADAIMAMGYDFNWSGSSRAGGVAPIESPYALDVDTAMAAYLAKVPASRLIWGVPYYGRWWTTEGSTLNDRTCAAPDTPCTAASAAFTYTSAVDRAATHGRRWDAVGQVPWYTHTSDVYDSAVQGYYDDATSLSAKYNRINDAGLRGVGIWHLLMDAGRWELWNEITRRFSTLPFSDIDDSAFWQEIVWLAETGITGGCGQGRFCPEDATSRQQMASFLVRAFDLPPTSTDFFVDDSNSVHEDDINRLAAAGITGGCAASRFCPASSVRRDAMASFLARALLLPPTTVDAFTDDDASVHEGSINRLAAAGIVGGCAANRYCPAGLVTRGMMAAFLSRSLRSS